MPYTQALYYPWIDIEDETWLKTSLLYWDSVRTIVPASIEMPYSTETGRALQHAEFLIPLRVNSGMEEIEELTNDVLKYLNTSEGNALLLRRTVGRRHNIHRSKLPNQFSRYGHIHTDKLPNHVRRFLNKLTSPSARGLDWLQIDERLHSHTATEQRKDIALTKWYLPESSNL